MERNNYGRRDALKAIGAAAAAGSLAGCSELPFGLGADDDVVATPLTITGRYEGDSWGNMSLNSGDPTTIEGPFLAPTGGAELSVPIGDGSDGPVAKTYGVTHTIETVVAGVSDLPHRPFGEILAVATPTGDAGGDATPATDVSAAEAIESGLFGARGSVSKSGTDGPTDLYELSKNPSTESLFAAAYSGGLASMSIDGSLEEGDGGVSGTGTVTFYDPDRDGPRQDGEPLANVACSFAGTKFESEGALVYLLGWFRTETEVTNASAPSLVEMNSGRNGSLVSHSSECPESGCIESLIQTLRNGRVAVLKRRLHAVAEHARRMQTIAEEIGTAHENASGLLSDLNDETGDGDQARTDLISAVGEDMGTIGTLMGNARTDLIEIEDTASSGSNSVSPTSLSTVSEFTSSVHDNLDSTPGKVDSLATAAQDAATRVGDYIANNSGTDERFGTIEQDLTDIVGLSESLTTRLKRAEAELDYTDGWVPEE